jgi:DNA polymerase-3 subunit gamma/tau
MSEANQSAAYRVLARKYRPAVFGDLIGQESMVRTLSNAFASDRIAHAFLLTGVRGIGKTTTARIIARALNCIGPDGKGEPTIQPCGACELCLSIAGDRYVDVIEMYAASRTGVEDIRSLIDGVRYAPVGARYKVYIIDEVHMLSKQAVNALLKTLEEPPPHVVFVFATTEVRKLPLTVLSRCQRFDLRRVEPASLSEHLAAIAAKEHIEASSPALGLIARAAEGSVRDALSLLDQAIVSGEGKVDEGTVRDMLGLADRGRTLDLLDSVFSGDMAAALASLHEQTMRGADPVVALQDFLDIVHWLTRLKVVPDAVDIDARTVAEQERGATIAARLSLPALTRAWQMLLKGLDEAHMAPDPRTAVEMTLIRLAYVADLPAPAEVVARLSAAIPAAAPASEPSAGAPEAPTGGARAVAGGGSAPAPARQPEPAADPRPRAEAGPAVELADFEALVALAGTRREPRVRAELTNSVHLVRFEPGRIEFRPTGNAPPDLANRLRTHLADWTGRPWAVVVSAEAGAPTLREQGEARREERFREAGKDPLVCAVLDAFPGASIADVRDVDKNTASSSSSPSDEDPDT